MAMALRIDSNDFEGEITNRIEIDELYRLHGSLLTLDSVLTSKTVKILQKPLQHAVLSSKIQSFLELIENVLKSCQNLQMSRKLEINDKNFSRTF